MAAGSIRPSAAITVLLAGLALGSCGFRPLHAARSGGAEQNLAQVKIAIIADRTGQKLHNLLRDKLNPKGAAAKPRYVLRVTLKESIRNLAIRKDEIATRANLLLRATFRLDRLADKAQLLSGTAASTNSYNILRSDFATLSAESDARDRAVREISHEIRSRIAIFLDRQMKSQEGGRP